VIRQAPDLALRDFTAAEYGADQKWALQYQWVSDLYAALSKLGLVIKSAENGNRNS
jgi:hypothetical protein